MCTQLTLHIHFDELVLAQIGLPKTMFVLFRTLFLLFFFFVFDLASVVVVVTLAKKSLAHVSNRHVCVSIGDRVLPILPASYTHLLLTDLLVFRFVREIYGVMCSAHKSNVSI